jgi:hypothetical protein
MRPARSLEARAKFRLVVFVPLSKFGPQPMEIGENEADIRSHHDTILKKWRYRFRTARMPTIWTEMSIQLREPACRTLGIKASAFKTAERLHLEADQGGLSKAQMHGCVLVRQCPFLVQFHAEIQPRRFFNSVFTKSISPSATVEPIPACRSGPHHLMVAS